jgi:hypothetical protein
MKSIYKLIYLSAFLLLFSSCQKEVAEIIQPTDGEVLKPNANITALVQKTVKNDGSKDNIMDNASCLNVKLPVTVIVNGLEITVDSEEDFDVIEAIFDEFDEDDDDLTFIFPIVIVLNDYTEITINNYDELENLIEECENEIDDDIECLDFVYPITLSVYDEANQLIETITVESDEQFYKIIDDIEDYQLVAVNFPITVILFDGTEKLINTMDELENTIEEVKDMCDEDDDNDYDDDDCKDCTQEQLTELLLSCTWTVDKLKINGVDNTEQYTNYTFWFLEDGTLKAKETGDYIYGTWIVDTTDSGILVKINFENLTDFSFNWVLYEIEENAELDLRFEDNRLELEKECIDDKIELNNILNEGTWIVANYTVNEENYTSTYNDFLIDFKEDFTVTATKDNDIVSGIWEVEYDSGELKLDLNFGETAPFNEFNEDWRVLDVRNDRVEVKYIDSDTGELTKLVFEKAV